MSQPSGCQEAYGVSQNQQRKLQPLARTKTLLLTIALVAAGEGVALIPALALESLSTEGVHTLDLPGLGMRRVVLRHLVRSRAASPGLDVAIGLVREASAAFSYESSGL